MEPRVLGCLATALFFTALGCSAEPEFLDASARDERAKADVGEGASDAGQTAAEAEPVPASWVTVQGACGVSLTGPDLAAFAAQGTDSCVGRFYSEDCSYNLDLGGFSDPLTRFDAEQVVVDSKPARLVHARDTGNGYLAGIHIPALWGGSVSVTMVAQCTSESAQATALRVLRTIELPNDERAAAAAFVPTPTCTGDDERPILAYPLGRGCAQDKVPVPGLCAVGAKANYATGNGDMLCFVDVWGSYYWGLVAFGETIEGGGAKHGLGGLWPDELTEAQASQCASLIEQLSTATVHSKDPITGEFVAAACRM